VACGLCSCLVQENKDPEAVRRRAMQDPEIQQIIADPAMQLILQQMQKDPQALREYVSFPLSVLVCLSVCTFKLNDVLIAGLCSVFRLLSMADPGI